MTWARPEWLIGLWALPILIAWSVWMLRRRRHALVKLGALIVQREAAFGAHRVRMVGFLLVMGLGMIALAQPRWGFRWQELQREGLDLVLVLDISRSMDAEDLAPSRLERARREVIDLVNILEGDRVGLVVFAGGAYPRMPLTLDQGSLLHMVRDSTTDTLTQGSDIGAAIDMAVQLLGDPGPADRAIWIISDGEDHEGRARDAARSAVEQGVHIFTMGVGTQEGAPIPLAAGGFQKDDSGSMVLTNLDESLLQELASIGKGAYVRSGVGDSDVRGMYLDEIQGRLQGAQQGVRRDKVWDERYQWPLGVGFAIFVLAVGRRHRSAVAAMLLLCVMGLPRGAWASGSELEALIASQERNPGDLDLAERLGLALAEDGQSSRAESLFRSVAERSSDPAQRQRAKYNAGLAAYQGGRLVDAMEGWTQVLEEAEEHVQTQQNLEAVKSEIQQRLNPEPPEPSDDSQESDENSEQQDGQQQDSQQSEQQQEQNETSEQQQGEDSEEEAEEFGGEIREKEGSEAELGEEAEEGGEAVKPNAISEGEAERLFDAAEEGSPRLRGGQRTGGKAW